jgi:hypothetical protein
MVLLKPRLTAGLFFAEPEVASGGLAIDCAQGTKKAPPEGARLSFTIQRWARQSFRGLPSGHTQSIAAGLAHGSTPATRFGCCEDSPTVRLTGGDFGNKRPLLWQGMLLTPSGSDRRANGKDRSEEEAL